MYNVQRKKQRICCKLTTV